MTTRATALKHAKNIRRHLERAEKAMAGLHAALGEAAKDAACIFGETDEDVIAFSGGVDKPEDPR